MPSVADSIDLTALEATASAAFLALVAVSGICIWALSGLRQAWIAVPGGTSVGLLGWLVLINAYGHVAPVGTASWLAAGTLGVAGAATTLRVGWRRLLGFDGLSRRGAAWLVVLTACFTSLAFLATLRVLLYDDEAPSHTPSVLAMVSGSFPPVEPSRPWEAFNYHYLPDLLPAALLDQFGVPVWWGYDILILLTAALMVPLCFAAAALIGRSRGVHRTTRFGLVAASLAVLGNSWQWMRLFFDDQFADGTRFLFTDPSNAIRTFGGALINNADAGRGFTTAPILNNMHTKSAAVGFVCIALLAIAFHLMLDDDHRTVRVRRTTGVILAILGIAACGLAAETYLAVGLLGFGVTTLAYAIAARSVGVVVAPLIATTLGLLACAIQGGVLTRRGSATTGEGSFVLSDTLGQTPTFRVPLLPSWSSTFLIEWLPLVIPAVIVLVALMRRRDPWAFGIGLMGVISLAIPLTITYTHFPPEIIRFYPIGTLAFAVLTAVAVCWLLDRDSRFVRGVTITGAATLFGTSVVFAVQSIVVPLGATVEGDAAPGDYRFLGHPRFDAATIADLEALREIPVDGLVASAPNRTWTYSGRLPAFTPVAPENPAISEFLTTADPSTAPPGYRFSHAVCVQLPGTDCSQAFAALDANAEFTLVYRRVGDPGEARIYRFDGDWPE